MGERNYEEEVFLLKQDCFSKKGVSDIFSS